MTVSNLQPEQNLRSWSTHSLPGALGLRDSGELISIVGGGGKSALLFGLGQTLPGRTLLTTTTRIFAAQTSRAKQSYAYGSPECEAALRGGQGGLLVIGKIEGEKAKGVAPNVPARLLALPGVDSVVVEADGSRMLPAKAPGSHEPVLPEETTLLVALAGIDALDGPIEQTCHRPERVSERVGLPMTAWLDPEALARLLSQEQGGLKGLTGLTALKGVIGLSGRPALARAAIFINKVETETQWASARTTATAALRAPHVERVVLGAIEPGGRGQAMNPSALTKAGAQPYEVYVRVGEERLSGPSSL